MNKILELTREAGIDVSGYNEGIDEQAPSEGQLQYFYDLARADLEAENAKLREALERCMAVMEEDGSSRGLAYKAARAAMEKTNA